MRPLCEHNAQAAGTASYSGAHWAVSWPPPRPYCGRVASMHRSCHGLVMAHGCRGPRRVATPSTVSQAPPCRVTARMRALGRHVAALLPSPPVTIQRIVSQLNPCRACRSSLHCVIGSCCAVSQPLAHCVTTPGLPLLSRYTHLYRNTPPNDQAMRAQAAHPARRSAVLQGLLAVLQRPVARQPSRVAPLSRAQAMPVTIQNIVS